MPRAVEKYDTFELNEEEKQFKKEQRDYYAKYLKSSYESKKQKFKSVKDYDLSNKKLLLLKDMKFEDCVKTKPHPEKHPSFIPLTAFQLYKIKIYPRDIRIGKVRTS